MAGKGDKAETLRKITIATVTGLAATAIFDLAMTKGKDKPFPLVRIWGLARRTKPGSSDFGAFVKFLGDFRALDIQTGALYRSSVALLPRFMEEQLAGAMGSGDNAKPAQFGVEIAVKFDAKAATKYVYIDTPMLEAEQSDEMTQLENRIRDVHPKALPAPAKSS